MELDTATEPSTTTSEPGVSVTLSRVEPFVLLTLAGEIDVSAAAVLRERLGDLVSGGEVDVLIHLGEVSFIDSSGLGLLVGAHKKLGAVGGSLGLVASSRPVRRLMTMTALDQVLRLHESVAAALATRVAAVNGV